MYYFGKYFSLTNKFLPLVFIAAFFDLLQLRDIMDFVTQGFRVSLTIPGAMPSIVPVLSEYSYVFNINIPLGGLQGGLVAIFMGIMFFLLGIFLKGGFLGSVFSGLKGESFSLGTFIGCGKKFFGRFMLQILFMIFVILVSIFPYIVIIDIIISILGFLGVVLTAVMSFVLVLALIFLLFFWDYAMVVEDIGVIDGAKKSWNVVKNNVVAVFIAILCILIANILLGILASLMVWAGLILAVLAIIGYAYFATVIIFFKMSFYQELSNEKVDSLDVIAEAGSQETKI